MKNLSFTHPHVIPNLSIFFCRQQDITKHCWPPIDFLCVDTKYVSKYLESNTGFENLVQQCCWLCGLNAPSAAVVVECRMRTSRPSQWRWKWRDGMRVSPPWQPPSHRRRSGNDAPSEKKNAWIHCMLCIFLWETVVELKTWEWGMICPEQWWENTSMATATQEYNQTGSW